MGSIPSTGSILARSRAAPLPMLRASIPFLLLLAVACNTPPPRPWLRFEPSGSHVFRQTGPGQLEAEALGARLAVDLHRKDTQIRLELVNGTAQDLEVRVGPEARENPTAAIGELQRRRLDGSRGEEVPDFVPYVALQPMPVLAGYRATFHLDNPLGREVVIGQYFVLVVEIRDAQGRRERRLLPLVATNAGTRQASWE